MHRIVSKKERTGCTSSARDQRVPVTVITGSLGSGKTTLLNHILTKQHGRKVAVIENEFGEVGVDDALVTQKALGMEDVFEMNKGCICCTVRADLIDIIIKLLRRKGKRFDAIVIETTGLADPAPVAQTFLDSRINAKVRLDAIVTVVDSQRILQRLDEERAEGIKNEVLAQVAFANRLVVNKIDTITSEQLAKVIRRLRLINHHAKMLPTRHGELEHLSDVLHTGAFDLARVVEVHPDFHTFDPQACQHDETVASVGLRFKGDVNFAMLQIFIDKLVSAKGDDILRYKGIFSVKNTNKKYILQGVHDVCYVTRTQRWEDHEERENRFVVIGRGLDRESITDCVMACQAAAAQPLRFEVGRAVECHIMKGWAKGHVIRHWNEGHAYRVRLNGGSEVWAPVDEDKFIRDSTKNKP